MSNQTQTAPPPAPPAAAPAAPPAAPRPSRTQQDSQEAQGYCNQLIVLIGQKKGKYLRDDQGEFSVLLDGKRIALNYDRENHDLNRLLLKVCKITLHERLAGPTVARLINVASAAAGKFKLRKFSAMSQDGRRLYLPLKNHSQLLCITAEKITEVPNGGNDDCLWIEHPESEAIDDGAVDRKHGVAEFERLIVETQACRVPEMRWFVAMEEGLFPFVRDLFSARFLTVHTGSAGSGKTTGAEMISRLHGLGDVKGDWTVAALSRVADIGALVMDNREQANMWQS